MLISSTLWRSQPAYLITTDSLSFVVTVIGAHLASLTLATDGSELNPLWQPRWPAGKPTDVGEEKTWGEGIDAPLLATIVGSNLCCDRFGASYPNETPRPLHGEAGVLPWARVMDSESDSEKSEKSFTFHVTLPIAQLSVLRSFAVKGTTLHITTSLTLSPSVASPQNVEVCEHTTLGNAFLDDCVITASVADLAYEMPSDNDTSPLPQSLPSVSALRVPPCDAPPEGSVRVALVTAPVDAQWMATNERLRRRLTVGWKTAEFPWLTLWTEHRQRSIVPWAGEERARGMELTTKPFPQVPPESRAETFLGIPTRIMCSPGQTITKNVSFTLCDLDTCVEAAA